jgi:hypothetical protein
MSNAALACAGCPFPIGHERPFDNTAQFVDNPTAPTSKWGGGFKSEAQQGVDEWKLRISKRLQAYVRRPRMANETHG